MSKEHHGGGFVGRLGPLASCLAYSVCSIGMVLGNKLILTTYAFKFPMVLLFWQNLASVGLLRLARHAGVLDFEPISAQKAKGWLPVNVFFVLMLLTGFFSLKMLSIPMVTIFKNTNNILVTVGDWYFFDRHVALGVMGTLALMVLAALLAGYEDLEFSPTGYLWMLVNCISTTSYVLYMRHAMANVELSRWSMIFYNNTLSLPLIVLGDLLVFGETAWFLRGPVDAADNRALPEWSAGLIAALLVSGCLGFAMSMASFQCIHATSPTTYSMVGSLNKIPLALLGFYLFDTNITAKGGLYIALSLFAGVLYAHTKNREKMAEDKLKKVAVSPSANNAVASGSLKMSSRQRNKSEMKSAA